MKNKELQEKVWELKWKELGPGTTDVKWWSHQLCGSLRVGSLGPVILDTGSSRQALMVHPESEWMFVVWRDESLNNRALSIFQQLS
jgi:hypothetical protein